MTDGGCDEDFTSEQAECEKEGFLMRRFEKTVCTVDLRAG
jgi:hypothetical protein